jgi:hypothetical protein
MRKPVAARTAVSVCLALVLFGLAGLSCKKNHSPIISALNAPASVEVDVSAAVTCLASDADGDALTYAWTCTAGSLSSSSGESVWWTAPAASGSATISVTVEDTQGSNDATSKTITVTPAVRTEVDWDGQVAAHQWTYWNVYIKSGYTVSGSFSVDNYDITFLVLDESNYENWVNNNSYTYVVKVVQSAGSSFSAAVGASGIYYIVLDNTYSWLTDKFAHLFVQTTSP